MTTATLAATGAAAQEIEAPEAISVMMMYGNVDWKVFIILVLLFVLFLESLGVLAMAIALFVKCDKNKERREAPFEEARVPEPPAAPRAAEEARAPEPPMAAEAAAPAGEDIYLEKELWVTESGDRYHETTCKHLDSARVKFRCRPITACSTCNPRFRIG